MLTVISLAVLCGAAPAWGDRALVVGINKYRHISPLRGAVADAEAVARYLQEAGIFAADEIRHLRDEEATLVEIRRGLDWLAAPHGERVLFYFAGHGVQVADRPATADYPADEADHCDEALVPVEYNLDDPTSALLRDDEIHRWIQQLDDRQVTIVLDSCFSGTAARSVMPGATARLASVSASCNVAEHREERSLLPSQPGLTVWTAVASHQLAWEDHSHNPPRGVFTLNFLEGLTSRRQEADGDGDGQVDHLELWRWLQVQSQRFCDKINCQYGLNPSLEAAESQRGIAVEAALKLDIEPSEEVIDLHSEAPDFLAPPTGDISVELQILPNNTPVVGALLRYRVTSNVAGYLTLLEVTPVGQLRQLFPNRYSQAKDPRLAGPRIKANTPRTLPDYHWHGFRVTAAPPTGEGRVVALVTADPISFDDLARQQQALNLEALPADAGEQYLAQMVERLHQIYTQDRFNRLPRWGVAETLYEIRSQ